uniref:Ribonuclease A-domain domain-containing protein n=1 Tax=Stegastes partitus TaxID=144197 RepID=A0A3B5B2V6_9TELE
NLVPPLLREPQFRRQHIGGQMAADDCDAEMSRKRIYAENNYCKDVNSFILGSPNSIKAICQGQGTPYENTLLTKSNTLFKTVVCELKNEGAKKPHCQYKGKLLKNRAVVVGCEQQLPVHFADDILIFG